MAKTTIDAAKATLTFDTVELGITDLSFGTEIEEQEAFDTKSEDYLGGKITRPISFTYTKDVTVAALALETDIDVSFTFADEAANEQELTGTIILFSETFNAGYGGVLTISVNGKFTEAYDEGI